MTAHEAAAPAPQRRLVRPYLLTGGRTSADVAPLAVETQVVTNPDAPNALDRYRFEAGRIVAYAYEPRALVEIASELDLPLGVALVIVADLIADGALIRLEAQGVERAELLERVLHVVRNI